MSKPIVAIVGRPNVGKSTLFNRLVGRRKAIVSDVSGTTRDRLYGDTSWRGRELAVVDMGGLESRPGSPLGERVREQVKVAIDEADIVLFLVDVRDGVIADDWEVADMLRRCQKPVALVANKVDRGRYQSGFFQFYELGMGDPIPISAYHGRGVDELMDQVVEWIPDDSSVLAESELMKVAIVGRPNVGKSMLFNAIIGEERAIVDAVPGTTRDALDTLLEYEGEGVVFVDTAGMRRRGRIEQGIEQYSLLRGMDAIERADVALLVVDASEEITAQDTHILGYVKKAYKGAVIIVNKWDLVPEPERDEVAWASGIRESFKFMPYVPILFTSGKMGYGIQEILPTVKRVYSERMKRLSRSVLERSIREAMMTHAPPAKGPKHVRLMKVSQTGVNPPTFVFVVNDDNLVHFSYQRYLENRLRRIFGFEGTPLRLVFERKRQRYGST